MQFYKHLPPVDQDHFRTWLNDPITIHLFTDLENGFLDSCIDPLPTSSMDSLTIEAIKREGRREFIERVVEWSPAGCVREEL